MQLSVVLVFIDRFLLLKLTLLYRVLAFFLKSHENSGSYDGKCRLTGRGGGVRAAIKGYRVAIKTGTAKKVGPDGKYINAYIFLCSRCCTGSRPRFALVVIINEPKAGNIMGCSFCTSVWHNYGRGSTYDECRAWMH